MLIALAVLLFLLVNINSLIYGINQLSGQIRILQEAVELEEVMASESFPDSLKIKLSYINEIKHFAVDSLGFNETDNYTTVFDQKGKDILWIVTACPAFELKAYEWKFPLFGSFPYKGYFDFGKVVEEEKKMLSKGFDTDIRRVSGWSTLGWFRDPILSNMLYKSEGELANTIIHELTHETIFIKDQVDLNENLATFVGDYGALKYLELKYGIDHSIYKQYLKELEEEKLFTQYVIEGASELDSLYNSFTPEIDSLSKNSKKTVLIRNWVLNIDTTNLSGYSNFRSRALADLPNNTFFMSYIRYNSMQNSFEEEFLNSKGLSFSNYVDSLLLRYAEN